MGIFVKNELSNGPSFDLKESVVAFDNLKETGST